jgi:hypothetical protein
MAEAQLLQRPSGMHFAVQAPMCFTPESGHWCARLKCPLRANSGHSDYPSGRAKSLTAPNAAITMRHSSKSWLAM